MFFTYFQVNELEIEILNISVDFSFFVAPMITFTSDIQYNLLYLLLIHKKRFKRSRLSVGDEMMEDFSSGNFRINKVYLMN